MEPKMPESASWVVSGVEGEEEGSRTAVRNAMARRQRGVKTVQDYFMVRRRGE